jgi:hypothetical protein
MDNDKKSLASVAQTQGDPHTWCADTTLVIRWLCKMFVELARGTPSYDEQNSA